MIRNGFSEKGSFIYVFAKCNKNTTVGFTAVKRVRIKPKRNKIKRLLRELWRTRNIPTLPTAQYVLMGNEKMENENFESLSGELNHLLDQISKRFS